MAGEDGQDAARFCPPIRQELPVKEEKHGSAHAAFMAAKAAYTRQYAGKDLAYLNWEERMLEKERQEFYSTRDRRDVLGSCRRQMWLVGRAVALETAKERARTRQVAKLLPDEKRRKRTAKEMEV